MEGETPREPLQSTEGPKIPTLEPATGAHAETAGKP